jgi:hydroxylamine reductase
MGMFCYQCQETAKNTGCTVRGVCGKTEDVAKLQDLLIYTMKGIGDIVVRGDIDAKDVDDVAGEVLNGLFMTITNANFDPDALEAEIRRLIDMRDQLAERVGDRDVHDAATFAVTDRASMLEKASEVGVLATEDEDIRSLRETITYGLKGMAAYLEHARHIGEKDDAIHAFIFETLAALLDPTLTLDDLVALTLKTGEYGVKAMALLDHANTSRYGNPKITDVDLGTRDNPAILISGHDLVDLEQLLEQTVGTGVDVYTHGEMLPAHYYPAFDKYEHFAGNYGGSWWQQLTDFDTFKGPILFTTNCIVPPRKDEIRQRIFTTGSAGYPGCVHIEADADGHKDFSEIIDLAKTLPAPEAIETGKITGGFAHSQVAELADQVVDAVKAGAIRKFVVMAGCDGRMKSRAYYTEFAKQLPKDVVILTAGCAKYRYIKLPLGDINGIPRVLDAGQCNDSYSLVVIAQMLKDAFGLDDMNDLPLAFNIAWYEQKAVIVLLALLSLGIRNIHLGPTLPGFLSPGVTQVLVDTFGLAGITDVDDDLATLIGA